MTNQSLCPGLFGGTDSKSSATDRVNLVGSGQQLQTMPWSTDIQISFGKTNHSKFAKFCKNKALKNFLKTRPLTEIVALIHLVENSEAFGFQWGSLEADARWASKQKWIAQYQAKYRICI